MIEQELRDKIIGIVLDVPITGIKIREILGGEAVANNIADALIAVGLGDVKVLKRALQIAACDSLDYTYDDFIEQAEKELQEENK